MHGRRGPFIANKIAQCPQPLCPFLILAQSEAGGEGTPLFFFGKRSAREPVKTNSAGLLKGKLVMKGVSLLRV